MAASGAAPPPVGTGALKVSVLAAHVKRLATPGSAERDRAISLAEAMRASKHCGMATALKVVGDLAHSVAAVRAAAFNAEE